MKKKLAFTVVNGTERISVKDTFNAYLNFNYFPGALKELSAEVVEIEFDRFCEKHLNN
jgi:hypothetical protein